MDENQKFDEKVRLGAILGSDIKNFLKFNKKDNQDSADYIREAIQRILVGVKKPPAFLCHDKEKRMNL